MFLGANIATKGRRQKALARGKSVDICTAAPQIKSVSLVFFSPGGRLQRVSRPTDLLHATGAGVDGHITFGGTHKIQSMSRRLVEQTSIDKKI